MAIMASSFVHNCLGVRKIFQTPTSNTLLSVSLKQDRILNNTPGIIWQTIRLLSENFTERLLIKLAALAKETCFWTWR